MFTTYILYLLHVFVILIFVGLVHVSKSKFVDQLYAIIIVLALLSWLILKGECCISLVDKLIRDNNYVIGSNKFLLSDLDSVGDLFRGTYEYSSVNKIPENKADNFIDIIIHSCVTFNLWLVQQRSHVLPTWAFWTLIFMFLSYLIYLRTYYRYYHHTEYRVDWFDDDHLFMILLQDAYIVMSTLILYLLVNRMA